MRIAIFAALSAGVLVANLIGKFDTDPGGYPDIWYPRKQSIHFAAAAGIALGACWFGVPMWIALGITIVDGVLFEFTQGYVNRHDIAADILGALAGIGIWSLL